jgi:hypothetical protein
MNDETLRRTNGALALTGGALEGASADSAVSWAAIFAGATAAAGLSLILPLLGAGLGLSTVSPWSGKGASAGAIGLSTIVWLTFTQIVAAGIGGYLAGRLRVRWAATDTDEIYFRDTAHGFLAWAVATLVTAALLASAIGSLVSSGVQAGATVSHNAASVGAAALPAAGRAGAYGAGTAYVIDSLFRKEPALTTPPPPTADAPAVTRNDASNDGNWPNAEVGRIFEHALSIGALAAPDGRYVAQRVAQQTGVSQADAQQKVSAAFNSLQVQADQAKTEAKEAADSVRKATAYAALWLFVSLLIGAFCASWAATYGGRRRALF